MCSEAELQNFAMGHRQVLYRGPQKEYIMSSILLLIHMNTDSTEVYKMFFNVSVEYELDTIKCIPLHFMLAGISIQIILLLTINLSVFKPE